MSSSTTTTQNHSKINTLRHDSAQGKPHAAVSDQSHRDFQKAMERKPAGNNSKQKQNNQEENAQGVGPYTPQNYGDRILASFMGDAIAGLEASSAMDIQAISQYIEGHITEGFDEIHIDISQFLADTAVIITEGEIRFEASAESVALLKEHLHELKRELERFGRVEIKESQEQGQPDQQQRSRNQYVAVAEEENVSAS